MGLFGKPAVAGDGVFGKPSGAASLLASNNNSSKAGFGSTGSLFKAAGVAAAPLEKTEAAAEMSTSSPSKSLFGGGSTGFGATTAEGKPAGASSLFAKSVGTTGPVSEAPSSFGGGSSLFGGGQSAVSSFGSGAAPPRFGAVAAPLGAGTPDRPTFGSSSAPPTGGYKTSLFGSGGAASGNDKGAQQSPQPSMASTNLFGSAAGTQAKSLFGSNDDQPAPTFGGANFGSFRK